MNIIRNELIKSTFDGYFVAWNLSKGGRSGFHASSLIAPDKGTKAFCYREHILGIDHKRIPSEYSLQTLRVFSNGWELHRKWQGILQIAGVALYNEVEHFIDLSEIKGYVPDRAFTDVGVSGDMHRTTTIPSNGFALSFTPDSIIMYQGKPTVVEIKGYRNETYAKVVANPQTHQSYKDAKVQANLYMHLLGLKKSIILFDNKNDQNFFTIEEEYEPELIAPYVERGDKLQLCIDRYREGKIVKGVCATKDCTRAHACQMRDVCFEVPALRERYRLDYEV
jgi:hypothetical protein